jgi:SET domain-containing protein
MARAPRSSPTTPPGSPVPGTGPRIEVRSSGVHGKGVFARRPIAAGSRVVEYRGEVITWEEALRRHPHDPSQPHHTFYFHVDDGHVIDGRVNGNAARWINHACTPNCESDQDDDGRVWIEATRDIAPGEELFYDYGLVIDLRYTPKLKKEFECRCGTAGCRGTMLAPKRRRATPGHQPAQPPRPPQPRQRPPRGLD